ncbi:MAG: hypothetical protein U0R78_17440 [Nocardioidaceae bacterium]
MSELQHLESSYTDVYQIDVPLRAFNDHPPIRATRVIVSVRHLPDDHHQPATVRVSLTGEKIIATENGFATVDNDVRVYGLAEEPIRYNLCRDAVLATLERHEIAHDDVRDFAFLVEWDEHRADIDTRAVDLSGAMSPEISHTGS